jgi:hypothetical protein
MNMNHVARSVAGCVAGCVAVAVMLGGCVRTTKSTLPDNWSAAKANTAVRIPAGVRSECPTLAGRYGNAGEMAVQTPAVGCGSHKYRMRAEWQCDVSLARDIADLDGRREWVELRQPDQDTLQIVSSDPAVAVKELHRSHGDFTCTAHGLERTIHASMMSMGDNSASPSIGMDAFNGMGTAFGAAAYGSIGLRTLTRSFNIAADGALVMDVSESQGGLLLLIPHYIKTETYVRWPRLEPGLADADPPVAAAR